MDNPFRFSGIVAEPAFCDRKTEQKEIKQYIDGSQNIVLYSHRRYGKSSLILKIFRELKNVTPVYIDLYGTTGSADFIAAFLKGVSAMESQLSRLMKMIQEKIRSIGINFSLDPVTGMPTATPVFSRAVEEKTIDELFAFIEAFSRKKKMVVAFDEFQEIAAYGGETFEKNLRKSIQRHERISYIFAGSQRHLMMEMFNDRKRAFYLLATPYPLHKIKTAEYVKWIQGLYRKAERRIENRYIEDVAARCENHPMYVQQFFFDLWNETELSFESIDRTERLILEKRISQFAYLWDTLTLNQKRALKLIAGTAGKNLFAAENLDRFGFRTASQVTAALASIEKMGLLDKNETWRIHDPFFKRWLLSGQNI